MELLQNYKGDSSSDEGDEMEEGTSSSFVGKHSQLAVALPSVNLAPQVIAQRDVQTVAVVDPKTKELYYNPKYEELFQPEVFF